MDCSEDKRVGTDDFLGFLGSGNDAQLSEMASTRVVPSFLSAVRRYRVRAFSGDCLRIWVVSMLVRGMKFHQAKRYLGTLHTVFSDWNADKGLEDPFPDLIKDLAEPIAFDAKAAARNAAGLRRLIDIESKRETSVPLNVFLFLLYDVEAECEDVVRLPIDFAKYDCQQISDLIGRIPRKKRATYAFPLNQGNTTDKKIISTLQEDVGALLRSEGISFQEGCLRDSIRSLWISVALGSGLGFATVRGMMATMPEEYRILDLIAPARLGEEEKGMVIRRVADHINDTTVRWFIMRMRHKVTPDIVKDEIRRQNEEIYSGMDFYCPVYQTVEIGRDKKRKVIDNPYLPGILFMKLRSDRVDLVARRVSEYAWCYRWSREPGSPYSSMTQRQMETFQEHIGRLTPDISILLDERDEPFAKDTEVVISGGDRMVGHTGRITSVRNADGTRTYTLEITSDVSAKWTVKDIDEVYLRAVESK